MTPELAVQKAIRTRLIATPAVTALVAATSILDRNARPAPDPSIILGEDQTADEGDIARSQMRIYSTVHVWKKEPSLAGVKAIAWEMRKAVHAVRIEIDAPFHAADCFMSGARFLRDPDGVTSHAIVTFETIVQELAA